MSSERFSPDWGKNLKKEEVFVPEFAPPDEQAATVAAAAAAAAASVDPSNSGVYPTLTRYFSSILRHLFLPDY